MLRYPLELDASESRLGGSPLALMILAIYV